jgi:hypothetical protein
MSSGRGCRWRRNAYQRTAFELPCFRRMSPTFKEGVDVGCLGIIGSDLCPRRWILGSYPISSCCL